MSQDAHHVGHTVIVEQTQKLKRLHLESDGSINYQQGQVDNLSHIDHSLHVCGTLHKCDSLVFIRPQGDRASHLCYLLLREVVYH